MYFGSNVDRDKRDSHLKAGSRSGLQPNSPSNGLWGLILAFLAGLSIVPFLYTIIAVIGYNDSVLEIHRILRAVILAFSGLGLGYFFSESITESGDSTDVLFLGFFMSFSIAVVTNIYNLSGIDIFDVSVLVMGSFLATTIHLSPVTNHNEFEDIVYTTSKVLPILFTGVVIHMQYTLAVFFTDGFDANSTPDFIVFILVSLLLSIISYMCLLFIIDNSDLIRGFLII